MNKLTTAVWEITMGCNMRCKHCGSSCAEALPDELNTSEALEVCDQLKDLGLKVITLSGGEPTTRSDWHIIAKRLVDNGIITSIITDVEILFFLNSFNALILLLNDPDLRIKS